MHFHIRMYGTKRNGPRRNNMPAYKNKDGINNLLTYIDLPIRRGKPSEENRKKLK